MTGFVERAAGQYRLAIASGGKKDQIRAALAGRPIESAFEMIISADDCAVGKPDPAIYERALRQFNATRPKPPLLRATECLVIEDSRAGIQAGLRAGMRAGRCHHISGIRVDRCAPGPSRAWDGVDPAELAQRLF